MNTLMPMLDLVAILAAALVLVGMWTRNGRFGPGAAVVVAFGLVSVLSFTMFATPPWGHGPCGISVSTLLTAEIDWAPPGPGAGCGYAREQAGLATRVEVGAFVVAVALLAILASARGARRRAGRAKVPS